MIEIDRRGAMLGAGAIATLAASNAVQAAPPVELGQNFLNVGPFFPVEPREVLKVKRVSNNVESEVYYDGLTEDQKRLLLSIQKAFVAVTKNDLSGNISHLIGQISGEKGYYEVTIDYGRYRDEDVFQGGNFIGRGRIGVGLRLKAVLQTQKAGLNIGSLLPISANVNSNKMSGTIESTVIGIVNPRVSDLIQLPSNISDQTINKAIESMGAMKVLVDAPETKAVPHLLAVALKPNQSNAAAVIQSIT